MAHFSSDLDLLDNMIIEIEEEKKYLVKKLDEEKKEILHAKDVIARYQNNDVANLDYKKEIGEYCYRK